MNKYIEQQMTTFSTLLLKCAYFPLCSGCEIHGDVSVPPVWYQLKIFFQTAAPDIPIPLNVKEIIGWRTRSKLAVRGTAAKPEIGLFKRGSHMVVPIPDCPLHHLSINTAYAHVREAIVKRKIDPYDEQRGAGFLRYLQFAVDRTSGKVQLVCVLNRPSSDITPFVKQLYTEGGLHSVWTNVQPEQTNRIFGERWELCAGEPVLWEKVGSVECAFHPACFAQAHPSLFDVALQRIRAWVKPNSSILELYAGVGAIGLNLAEACASCLCVEINPFAEECFHLSRGRLPPEHRLKIAFQTASAETSLPLLASKNVAIVDPPRKGLEKSVLDALKYAKSLKQIIYLSCGPRSFQRDCEELMKGGWKIAHAEGFLFFPGCDHVEMLCCLEKGSG